VKKILCVIPARSGSKSIKNKNILKFLKKELIYYTIKFANSLNFIDKTIFSSDSGKYIKIAKKYGSKFNNLRPASISKDHSTTAELIKYLLKSESKNNFFYDYILILQPTSPFRQKKIFIEAYNQLKKNLFDTVITISKSDEHPYRMKVFKGKKTNEIKNFMKLKHESLIPRQKLSDIYVRAGSMYFTSVKSFYKNNSLVGKKVYGIVVGEKYSLNLDTNKDLILAKHYFND